MTTFAPHRDTLESFVDCIHSGVDNDVLTRLLAEDVVLYGPFSDEPVTGREVAVGTIKTSTDSRQTTPITRSSAATPTTPHTSGCKSETPRSTASSSSCSTRTARSPK
jgi:hypothetical protein